MACYSGFPGVFALRGSSGVATLLLLTLATAVPVSGSACIARFFRCRNQIPCGRFGLCAIMMDDEYGPSRKRGPSRKLLAARYDERIRVKEEQAEDDDVELEDVISPMLIASLRQSG